MQWKFIDQNVNPPQALHRRLDECWHAPGVGEIGSMAFDTLDRSEMLLDTTVAGVDSQYGRAMFY